MEYDYKIILSEGMRWVYNQKCMGYDPYDGCNTNIEFLRRNKYFCLFLVYFNKFSPINFRNVLKIKKRINLQAISFFIKIIINHDFLKKDNECALNKMVDYLISKSLFYKYGYHCWNGNDMYLQTKNELQSPEMPGVIGTVLIADALLSYYDNIEKKENIKEVILSACDFIEKTLLINYNNVIFIKYKPHTPNYSFTYNASIISANFILKVNKYFSRNLINEGIVKKCIYEVVMRQKEDGSWNYLMDLETKYEKKQIDFHQGFILDSLFSYLRMYPEDQMVFTSYMKGLTFFYEKQFFENGQSLYRYPKKLPTNIHNQAQGIITFSDAGIYDEKYLMFAEKILIWTLNNMYNVDKSTFYFLKFNFFSIKIPYIRWSQAYMLYAISHFITIKNNSIK